MDLLKGKTAVVTGGTRGIGLAIVKKFLANGAKVALLGSRQETVDKALAGLKEENSNYPVIGLCPALSNPEQVHEAFQKVKEAFGSLDILVNNAGVSARDSIYQYKPEDFAKVMDLNVNSVFVCSREAAGIMKEQGGGVILNTSSMVSIYGQPAGCAYPASKFAVNGMTKSLAREMGRDNIRVNAVAPGVTRTDMVAALPEEMVKRITAPIPLGRMGEPEEVADAFLFLASDMASYITGVTLSVDGAAMV
ncbi:MAG: 3-oxoacyl-ACP reductase FabG [Oscillospiraceae bacterium]|jgi:3-oxoacyl-[acyl-carrier protein] reductase/7-alpha-hydroxysteroid dehydrogenase|nr:3-oxoacyl-ACP reductase FabG [Oscillospiraceae bacterium]